jgi:hypothetical protein
MAYPDTPSPPRSPRVPPYVDIPSQIPDWNNIANPERVIDHASLEAQNERLLVALNAANARMEAMERDLSAGQNEREEKDRSLQEVWEHARAMEMERDGWKAESQRLGGMSCPIMKSGRS